MSELSGFHNRTAMEMNALCSHYIYVPNLREYLEVQIVRNLFSIMPQNVDIMDIDAGIYRYLGGLIVLQV